jgi:hypothetical protein
VAGGDWSKYAERVEEASGSLQELTRFSDDEYKSAFANMVNITGDAEQALKNMSLVADVARARNIDMATASDAVGKAMVGQIGRLGMLFPELQRNIEALGDTATDSERAAVAVEYLSSKFSGLAKEDAKSAAGQMLILKNQIAETQEQIGNAFLPVLADVGKLLLEATKGIRGFAEEHPKLVAALGLSTLATLGLIASVSAFVLMAPKIVLAINAITAAFTWLAANPIVIAVTALVAALGYLGVKFYDTATAEDRVVASTKELNSAIIEQNSSMSALGMVYDVATKKWISYNDALVAANTPINTAKKQVADLNAEFKFKSVEDYNNEITKLNELIAATSDSAIVGQAKEKIKSLTEEIHRLSLAVSADYGKDIVVTTTVENDYRPFKVPEAPEMPSLGVSHMQVLAQQLADEQKRLDAEVTAARYVENAKRLANEQLTVEQELAVYQQGLNLGMSADAAAEIAKTSKTQEEANNRVAIWQDEYSKMRGVLNVFEGTFNASTDALLNTDMNWKQKRNAIWKAASGEVINLIKKEVSQHIFGALAKAAADKAAAASGIAASTAATNVEKGNAITVMLAWIKAAYMKLLAFFSFSGPLAPVLAGGVIVASFAAIAALVGAALRMNKGGLVPGYGNGDTVPAMLTPGEYVINREAAQRNMGILQQINTGRGVYQGQSSYKTSNIFHEHHAMNVTISTPDTFSEMQRYELRRTIRDMIDTEYEKAIEDRRFRPEYLNRGGR